MTKTCPNCGKEYEPEFTDKSNAPEGSIYREQHKTGICSNECWNEWLGIGEHE